MGAGSSDYVSDDARWPSSTSLADVSTVGLVQEIVIVVIMILALARLAQEVVTRDTRPEDDANEEQRRSKDSVLAPRRPSTGSSKARAQERTRPRPGPRNELGRSRTMGDLGGAIEREKGKRKTRASVRGDKDLPPGGKQSTVSTKWQHDGTKKDETQLLRKPHEDLIRALTSAQTVRAPVSPEQCSESISPEPWNCEKSMPSSSGVLTQAQRRASSSHLPVHCYEESAPASPTGAAPRRHEKHKVNMGGKTNVSSGALFYSQVVMRSRSTSSSTPVTPISSVTSPELGARTASHLSGTSIASDSPRTPLVSRAIVCTISSNSISQAASRGNPRYGNNGSAELLNN